MCEKVWISTNEYESVAMRVNECECVLKIVN